MRAVMRTPSRSRRARSSGPSAHPAVADYGVCLDSGAAEVTMPDVTAPPLDAARLSRLLEAGRSVVSQLALDPVLEELLTAARELTGARYAAIGVLDRDRHELERFVTQGIDAATH